MSEGVLERNAGSVVQGELTSEIGETTEIGWSAPRAMTLDQWLAVGRTLQQVGRSLNFWIGDWLTYGERRYGESYAQGVELTGAAVESLKKYKAVAERVPIELRVADLTWSHHFAVCYLPHEQRGPMLRLAARFELGVRDLQRVVGLPDASRLRILELADTLAGKEQLLRTVQEALLRTLPPLLPAEDDDVPDWARLKEEGEEFPPVEAQEDSVVRFFRRRGMAVTYRDDVTVEWPGLRCTAIDDGNGSVRLMWEVDAHDE